MLDEFEKTGCLVCCSLKGCKCPEPSDNSLERIESIPEASANILHQKSPQDSSKGLNCRETLVRKLLRDQEAYPEATPELYKVNTAQRIYHSTRLKAFAMMTPESMPEIPVPCIYPPPVVYTLAPLTRALPQPVWVGLNWPRYVPIMRPGIPEIPIRPVIPGQVWPTNLQSMPNGQTGMPHTPQVPQTPESPVDAFFRRFHSPVGSLGSLGTSGSFATSESPDRSSDQVVPGGSDGIERLSR